MKTILFAITTSRLRSAAAARAAVLTGLLIGASTTHLHAATFSDHNWTGMGGYPGADDPVYATVVDGSGNLYIGGTFSMVGGVFANNIAKWDGTQWSALGSGLQGNDGFHAVVYALAVSGNDVYAAGHFTLAGGVVATSIAKWNGTHWSPLGSGITGQIGAADVYSLAVSGNDVYASGAFTIAGGNAANNIAHWNGSSWSALGSGLNGGAGSLAVSGSDVYAGGTFTNAGGLMANRVAKWSGSSWSALGSGVEGFDFFGSPNASVSALAISGNDLYVAGRFTTAGGIAATNMAKWNGSSWSVFPWPIYGAEEEAFSGWVNNLTSSGSDLYAAGIVEVGNIWVSSYAAYVVKWNGSSWSPLAPGMNGSWYEGWDPSVSALAVSGTTVYAGGAFTTAGDKTAHCISKWNGSSWSALGAAHGSLSMMAASGRDVYGVGAFVTADGTGSNQIAKWNGSGWSPVGSGALPNVSALAVSGSHLYASGNFTNVGGVAANRIARWNGSNWSALGSGINGSSTLAIAGDNLYAAGQFTTAGGIAAANIAVWNGSSWSPLGSGIGKTDGGVASVSALAVSGGGLYVGGNFTTAGGVAANNIAKWNGTLWSALGSGIGASPSQLVVVGSEVYAGGGRNMFEIAKWNGSQWSDFGSFEHYSGDGPDVWAMAGSGTDLYVGGWFSMGDVYHLAKWDGSHWSALGSGVNGAVRGLAATETELFVAGGFTTAGGKVSPYLAQARIGSKAQSVTASNSTASIRFSGVTGYSYDVQRATNLTPPIAWTTVTPLPLFPAEDGSFIFTDANATPDAAFYRLSKP